MNDDPTSQGGTETSTQPAERASLGRVLVALGLVAFGVFYLMLAMGGASFVHECRTPICGQLHQAVFAAVGAFALGVASYRLLVDKPSSARIVFFGTLPILIVHLILVATDPNESLFFPLSTTPPPLIAGLVIVYKMRVRGVLIERDQRRSGGLQS